MNPFAREHRNRDWLLFLLIFLLGLGCMALTGTLAIVLSPQWDVQASMDSKLDPDERYRALESTQVIEPVLPAILTPPSWSNTFLTPQNTQNTPTQRPSNPTDTPLPARTSTLVVVEPQVTASATARLTATGTFIIVFPSRTVAPSTRTPVPAFTSTVTRTATRTSTRFPTGTTTSTPTASHTATRTITPTPTVTFTPTITLTPTITATPTGTLTPTTTSTPTITMTPTATATPTVTLTPTITLTATITTTPTITPTPSPDYYADINFGPPSGGISSPPDNFVLFFDLTGSPISDHGDSNYDLIYYERPTGPGQIDMDQVRIEVGDGTNWYTVFYWGNELADTNSNLDISGPLGGSEADNRTISSGLIGGSGVGIDLYSLNVLGSYNYLRITAIDTGANDGIDIDSLEIIP